MRPDRLPRYARTPEGDEPDAFLLESDGLSPLSLMRAHAGAAPFPPALAAVDNTVAAIAAVELKVAELARVDVAAFGVESAIGLMVPAA